MLDLFLKGGIQMIITPKYTQGKITLACHVMFLQNLILLLSRMVSNQCVVISMLNFVGVSLMRVCQEAKALFYWRIPKATTSKVWSNLKIR
jgi:hypothetical protein